MTANDEAKVKEMLAALLAEGVSLSDAQNQINQQLEQKLTFMDIRIIASTLDVDWKKGDPHPVKSEEEKDETKTVSTFCMTVLCLATQQNIIKA